MIINDHIFFMSVLRVLGKPIVSTEAYQRGLIDEKGQRTSKETENDDDVSVVSHVNLMLYRMRYILSDMPKTSDIPSSQIWIYIGLFSQFIRGRVVDVDAFMNVFVKRLWLAYEKRLSDVSDSTIDVSDVSEQIDNFGYTKLVFGPIVLYYDPKTKTCTLSEDGDGGGDSGVPTNNVGNGEIAGTTPDTIPGMNIFGKLLRRKKKKIVDVLLEPDDHAKTSK